MSKKILIFVCILTVIIGVLISINSHYDSRPHTAYPLSGIKRNDTRLWELRITNLFNDNVLKINDNNILYENKIIFKVIVDPNVYMSTPQYTVEVLIDGKTKERYYLLELNQIEFGTIEQSLIE